MHRTLIPLLSVLFLAFISCNSDKSTNISQEKDSTSINDSVKEGEFVSSETKIEFENELEDDSVFEDGSIPTSWENAGINDPKALKLFIKKLQVWIISDLKDSIAASVDYPLRNNKEISSASEFLEHYDHIMTYGVKNTIRTQNLKQIFRNAQGAMLGDGVVWISDVSEDGSNNLKIISINN